MKLKPTLHGQTILQIDNPIFSLKTCKQPISCLPCCSCCMSFLLILRLFVNTLTETLWSILVINVETGLNDAELFKQGRTKIHTFSLHDCLYTIGKIQNGWTQLSSGDVNTTRLMKDTDWKCSSSNLIHKAHQWQLK